MTEQKRVENRVRVPNRWLDLMRHIADQDDTFMEGLQAYVEREALDAGTFKSLAAQISELCTRVDVLNHTVDKTYYNWMQSVEVRLTQATQALAQQAPQFIYAKSGS